MLEKLNERQLKMKSHTKHVQANILHSQPQLHQLALCFYEDECKPENLIEYHIFEYSYNDDRVTLDLHSKSRHSRGRHSRHTEHTFESVRERTVHLIRACVVIMQSCQTELPAAYDVSLRLYYNQGNMCIITANIFTDTCLIVTKFLGHHPFPTTLISPVRDHGLGKGTVR